ncbi:unnamed protein product [Soboliphyme baturini]|uniref:L27_1 domain-containing protein n=1 Tax=Soboliphyme baturini TaxID=241478 RepID=A0A183ISJ0_9BILA|nr:unnamed protein product [Soboliphyme baturini]
MWNGVIRKNGPIDLSNNGIKLLRFCTNNGLSVMKTFFEHRKVHQDTWYHEACAQKTMVDLIIVSSDLRRSAMDVRVKKGAELSTDHHLVVGTKVDPGDDHRCGNRQLFNSGIHEAAAKCYGFKQVGLPPGEAHRALELLEEYHKSLVRAEDRQLRDAIERVISIFKSRLFQALLGDAVLEIQKARAYPGLAQPMVSIAASDTAGQVGSISTYSLLMVRCRWQRLSDVLLHTSSFYVPRKRKHR